MNASCHGLKSPPSCCDFIAKEATPKTVISADAFVSVLCAIPAISPLRPELVAVPTACRRNRRAARAREGKPVNMNAYTRLSQGYRYPPPSRDAEVATADFD